MLAEPLIEAEGKPVRMDVLSPIGNENMRFYDMNSCKKCVQKSLGTINVRGLLLVGWLY